MQRIFIVMEIADIASKDFLTIEQVEPIKAFTKREEAEALIKNLLEDEDFSENSYHVFETFLV